ncbi:MAG: hypothetical protein ACK5G0_09165 [Bacteroidota bacterium]|jgi:O-antigen/teichoic acid export membrane protein
MIHKVILRLFGSSSFVIFRSLKLLKASIITALLPIIASVWLVRLYDPATSFSDYTIFISISSLFSALASSHFCNAIQIVKSDSEFISIVKLSFLFCFLISLASLLFLSLICYTSLLSFNVYDWIGNLVYLIPFNVFSISAYNILIQIAFRQVNINLIASARVFYSLIIVFLQTFFGLFLQSFNGLIVGYIIGVFFCTFYVFVSQKHIFRKIIFSSNYFNKDFKDSLRAYRHFLFYQSGSDSLSILAQQLPFLLTRQFSNITQDISYFGHASRTLLAPLSLITGPISDLFRQSAAKSIRENGSCLNDFLHYQNVLFKIMIGPSVIIFLFGPTIFRLIFGNEWQIAGEYAQILMIMYLPKMIVSPLSYLFILVGRQKEDFILHIFVVIISMAFFAGFLMYFDFKSALISYSIIYLFVYLVYYYRSKIFARNGV